jgi:hypothetical protein
MRHDSGVSDFAGRVGAGLAWRRAQPRRRGRRRAELARRRTDALERVRRAATNLSLIAAAGLEVVESQTIEQIEPEETRIRPLCLLARRSER